jgi:cytoskeletal protein RodZ
MKRVVQIILLVALIGLGFWLWTVLFPSPEKVVRSRLNALAKAISFKAGTGSLANAYNAQKAAEFFTIDVDVEVNLTGYEPITLHGRDEVLQIAMAARGRLTSLKVEFPDMNVTFGPNGNTAKVNLTGKATVPGERDISAQEFNFDLKKVDGKWLIYHVETVKTLSSVGARRQRTPDAGLNFHALNNPKVRHSFSLSPGERAGVRASVNTSASVISQTV